ncbi:hypothetical protein EI555_013298, partial [Monodon monoceros]
NVNAGHATPGFSASYWQRSSQEADKPPFALWAAWAKGLSRLGCWLSRRAADRTLVGKHCFLALPVLTLESVLSPAVLAEGLTPGFPACSFPSCRPGTVDTLRTGKWHRELRQGGSPVLHGAQDKSRVSRAWVHGAAVHGEPGGGGRPFRSLLHRSPAPSSRCSNRPPLQDCRSSTWPATKRFHRPGEDRQVTSPCSQVHPEPPPPTPCSAVCLQISLL